jgi:hypothetical protein
LKVIKKALSKLHKKEKIISFYSKRLTFSSTNENTKIVICFYGTFLHGGLVDRIKVMVSFYEVASQLNCDFKIALIIGLF